MKAAHGLSEQRHDVINLVQHAGLHGEPDRFDVERPDRFQIGPLRSSQRAGGASLRSTRAAAGSGLQLPREVFQRVDVLQRANNREATVDDLIVIGTTSVLAPV
jgi:hypothetical protein